MTSASARTGSGILNSLINALPFEAHLPGYRFCGPGTRLHKRLQRGDEPLNGLDAACREHDIAYATHKDTESRHLADKVLAEKAWKRVKSTDASFGERLAARLVTTIMKGKVAVGAGLRKQRKRVIPPPRGGFLPILPLLAALGAAGSLAGGASQIASAVNRKRTAERQLGEMKRHNQHMEAIAQGKGLRIKKRKGKGSKNSGAGLYLYRKKP